MTEKEVPATKTNHSIVAAATTRTQQLNRNLTTMLTLILEWSSGSFSPAVCKHGLKRHRGETLLVVTCGCGGVWSSSSVSVPSILALTHPLSFPLHTHLTHPLTHRDSRKASRSSM
ncbi:hypothetical protein E2C01_054761 [Portunus trituberculatus]|uniref:Uncharacterized protein n=1 Tax=Portunus trituberculatus TaxID=210409 RepID=A0A5B7GT33_PORTR|nr:hypothetical protein [Portunus trituberculatus]